jgi:hypothetical protein
VSAEGTLKALDQLKNSRGWAYLRAVMEQEAVAAAMAIADNPKMTLDEINFRRGTIWAAKQLLDLPDKLALRLQNEVALTRKDDLPSSTET